MVTPPNLLDLLPGQSQVEGTESPTQQNALANFAIQMTRSRQQAVRRFQEQTGLPQLPMQDTLMNLEMSVTQTLLSPLSQLPIPTEITQGAIPTPTEMIGEFPSPAEMLPIPGGELPFPGREGKKPGKKEKETGLESGGIGQSHIV